MIYSNLHKCKPFPKSEKYIASGNDDKAAFVFSVAAAVAKFEVISKALPGFFKNSC